MTRRKRLLELLCAGLLAIPILPMIGVISLLLLVAQGRPVFYVSERMRSPTTAFGLVKFRTMAPSENDSGVSGRDKEERITPLGRVLRRRRLDELPQLWNILKGDMSFVGPRPPLRQYVERFPELYAAVLRSRPGVTGLATLLFKDREAALLARCATAEETDAVYARRCIPRKAALDLIYQKRPSLCWDLLIMSATVFPRVPRR